jgi:hypothetical protein
MMCRRMMPAVLRALTFRSNNDMHRPLIRALNLLKQYADSDRAPVYYASTDDVPIGGRRPCGLARRGREDR